MAAISFDVSFGNTQEDAKNNSVSMTIYADDLGLCQECMDIVSDCYPCLRTGQQVFLDEALTTIVSDGYYRHPYNDDITTPTWYIVGGYPQDAGFFG
jgi:hypothetical protein